MTRKNCNEKKKRDPDFKEPTTATDVYANTEYRTKDGNVAIPTEESVDEAKDWVDNENPK